MDHSALTTHDWKNAVSVNFASLLMSSQWNNVIFCLGLTRALGLWQCHTSAFTNEQNGDFMTLWELEPNTEACCCGQYFWLQIANISISQVKWCNKASNLSDKMVFAAF